MVVEFAGDGSRMYAYRGHQCAHHVHPTPCTKYRACHANRTGKAAATKRPEGVHPTPWRAPSTAPATQITSDPIRPLGEHQVPRACRANHTGKAAATKRQHQVPRLPRKSHQQSCGDQATPGRTLTSDPLESTRAPEHHACHANHTGKPAATKQPQGVHPTPWRAPSTMPATQITPAKLRRPSDPITLAGLRRPSDPRAYIRPLSAAPATQITPWKHQAKLRRPNDPRAYIRPLGEHQVPRFAGVDQATSGRTSDRLESTKYRACHANRTGKAAATQRPQGAH